MHNTIYIFFNEKSYFDAKLYGILPFYLLEACNVVTAH
jgi:hypothetical protein